MTQVEEVSRDQAIAEWKTSGHVIPKIVEPLGRHWDQPALSKIIVDDKHALMSAETFKALHEYSCSAPSGVYEGKMWRRHDGLFDRDFLNAGGTPKWLLCWFGYSEDKSKCSNHHREILIA